MYDLPRAGIIAERLPEKWLGDKGYHQSKTTPGFWTHESRPICFTLIVDNFGVKYERWCDVDHLLLVLREDYELETDKEGKKYCGIALDWDYAGRKVHLSMAGHCDEALVRFGHSADQLTSPTGTTYPTMAPRYSTRKT